MRRAWLFSAAVAMMAGFAVPAAAHATVQEHGYLAARDGTRLRYDVIRPDGSGPFPVLVNYEGYAAGSDAGDNGVSTYRDRLLARGYAIVGVSVRGTGCSAGQFDPFAPTMGQDGYDAVEWAARQPWSDGRVGMIGVSFGGITQLLTAAQRPPHLKAIAPSSATSDLYRDVTYPGGILEYDFTFAWTGVQKEGGTVYTATGAPPDGDSECIQNYAAHEAANTSRDNFIPALILDHPYFDDSGKWVERAPRAGFHNIEAPSFLFNAWQDEQLPGRIFESLNLFPHPDRVWANFTNGNHGRDYYSATDQQLTLDFLDQFVRDVPNGFAGRVPHLTLAMETAVERAGQQNEPAWNIERSSLEPAVTQHALYLHSGGRLADTAPAGSEQGDTYGYPLPAPSPSSRPPASIRAPRARSRPSSRRS